jgi:hypothetical protein
MVFTKPGFGKITIRRNLRPASLVSWVIWQSQMTMHETMNWKTTIRETPDLKNQGLAKAKNARLNRYHSGVFPVDGFVRTVYVGKLKITQKGKQFSACPGYPDV